MSDCLFCKIVQGEIPSTKVFEDDLVLAFEDINPDAPHHILIIPKTHIVNVNDACEENQAVFGHLFVVAAIIAKEKGFANEGYRLIANTNKFAGQEVFHLHLHMLAGKKMGWKPIG